MPNKYVGLAVTDMIFWNLKGGRWRSYNAQINSVHMWHYNFLQKGIYPKKISISIFTFKLWSLKRICTPVMINSSLFSKYEPCNTKRVLLINK